jgi:L-malate glycosyltransferase
MKIAFILPSLANSGPIVFTKYLIDGIKNKGHEIHIFYFEKKYGLNFDAPCKKIGIFEKINFKEFDIVHTTCAKPDLYGLINKQHLKGKWVCSLHNYYKEDFSLLYKFPKSQILSAIWKISLRAATNIIVSSRDMMMYYANDIGAKNYKIIPYGIEKRIISKPIPEAEIKFLCDLKTKYKIIGSVGLLIKRKGFSQLVNFLMANVNCAVVIVGDGVERGKLEALAKLNGIEDRLHLLGFKNNSIEYYKYFDVYAMTSYSEGFGLAMLEALSCGLPLVCSHLQMYDDYFTSKEVCFFELDNVKSLESAISEALSKSEYYGRMAYNLYINKFSLKVMAEMHLNYYATIINAKNSID